MDEMKIREYVELARLFGYRLAVGQGWATGALAERYCCPMGAVLVVQRRGRGPDDGYGTSYAERVAKAMRCTTVEVLAFTWGFDNHGDGAVDPTAPAFQLGRKFRLEALAPYMPGGAA